MKTIAIVDDDIYIGDMLEDLLHREGYATLRAYSGTEALYLLSQHKPDLVLLDLMLPGLSGEEVLPRIEGVPVLVLSAKAAVADKVSLLMGGAADYITKPFDTKELLARIVAALRKSQGADSGVLAFEGLRLDVKSHELTADGVPVKLTRTEVAILRLLLQNPVKAIAKSAVLESIALDTPDCTESSLKQHVSNLRKKLRDACGKNYIHEDWGIGFRLG